MIASGIDSSSAVIRAKSNFFKLKKMVRLPYFVEDKVLNYTSGTMISMWTKNWNDTLEGKCVIPRSIYFTEKGESIAVFGLESGKL